MRSPAIYRGLKAKTRFNGLIQMDVNPFQRVLAFSQEL